MDSGFHCNISVSCVNVVRMFLGLVYFISPCTEKEGLIGTLLSAMAMCRRRWSIINGDLSSFIDTSVKVRCPTPKRCLEKT